MMRNILFAILMLALLGCTMDVGYYPSEEYGKRPVQYKFGGKCEEYVFPDCDKLIDGTVIYKFESSNVYVCIESYWTYMRQVPPESEEVINAVCYER